MLHNDCGRVVRNRYVCVVFADHFPYMHDRFLQVCNPIAAHLLAANEVGGRLAWTDATNDS
jgi:hypothetical protein